MYSIPQIVTFGTTQVMTQLLKPQQADEAFVTRFDRQSAEPVEERNDTIVLLKEEDLRCRHPV
jgi:hypothetical protein